MQQEQVILFDNIFLIFVSVQIYKDVFITEIFAIYQRKSNPPMQESLVRQF